MAIIISMISTITATVTVIPIIIVTPRSSSFSSDVDSIKTIAVGF